MAGLEVDVVAWPIEVHRQEEDAVEAVLLAVRLQLDQQRFLRHSVRRVRLLGISVPQIVLAEGDGGELRIRADGAEADELIDAGQARFLDEMQSHHGVVVEELAGRGHVRADSADDGG